MKYIVESKTLRKEFYRLCEEYRHYMWSVAWAGNVNKFELVDILERNASKIEKFVVGLHFYQTHPSFIESFMDKKGVRFAMQSDGTFHPKVYLFYNSKNDWAAIVGSSNFTASGFGGNCEANISLSSEDCEQSMFEQIKDSISGWWTNAVAFDREKLHIYEQNYKVQSQNVRKLKSFICDRAVSDMEQTNWSQFFLLFKQVGRDELQGRFNLLDMAQKMFKNNASFNCMDEICRKGFAGMLRDRNNENEPTWEFFGTVADGLYKHYINDLSSKLSNAIDLIPSSGEVTKKQFDAYVKRFDIIDRKNPLADISRLLAIKRPDLFVCINQANKDKLAILFNVRKSDIKVENYWNILESYIWSSEWYKEPKGDKKGYELKCWKYRVALLDCISCK